MTKDRLAALVAAQSDDDDDEFDVVAVNIVDRNDPMDALFAEVELIRDMIEKIETNMEKVKEKHSSILSTPQSDEQMKQELDDLMAEIKKSSGKVRAKLKSLDENIDLEEESAYSRMQQTQHLALSRKFVDIMTECNRTQTDYRERYKQKIQRQLMITGRQTTDEELEEMLEQGNVSVFTQDIIMETQEAKRTVAEIEARHADIIKLEKSIKDLHDMFMDMAMLVENQGELLDRVEYQVDTTRDYVEAGRSELKSAEKYQHRTRKKKILIIVCIVIIIVVLIILLAVFLNVPV